ncbi:MAG: hypothetical protein QOH62_2561 [Solirubrobacteraceae bacterium]|jgi:acetyltransferase-like isoleucine patch superfamily enzyme|nr:hypothetical protein [Solirubrobacteraceae bacterium]
MDAREARGLDWLALYVRVQGLRDRVATRLFARSFASFGVGCRLQLPLQVGNPRGIAIGDSVLIGPGCLLHAEDDAEVRLAIGDRTMITGYSVLSAAVSVRLGQSVLIGRGVHVTDHNHGRSDAGIPVRDQALDDLAPVEIGDGAWLAEHVVVLPGVRIGRGAVIGAHAVVRDDVPDRSVAVGAPARVVAELDREAR